MPRTRRTNSGAPGQPIAPVPGQQYGMGVEQQRLAEAMPAPAIQPAGPGGGTAAGAGAAVGAAYSEPEPATGWAARVGSSAGAVAAPSPDQVRAEQYQAAIAAAQQMSGRAGILTNPTRRPQEPVTAGLPIGPGPGPEVLTFRRGNPTGNTLRQLAAATGDPYLRELADRAGL